MKFSRMMLLALSFATVLGYVCAMDESAAQSEETAPAAEAMPAPAPEAMPTPAEVPAPAPEAMPAEEAPAPAAESNDDEDMDKFFKDLMLDESEGSAEGEGMK